MRNDALLVLEDSTVFNGVSIGIRGVTVGELIFNTAHVGYQEALTDPSYAEQIIVFTTPHIGNVGCNSKDEESEKFWANGLVTREKPTNVNYWRSQYNFQDYLEKHQVVGIAHIDTRCLTRLLRIRGHLSACIVTEDCDVSEAQQIAATYREVKSAALLKKVTTPDLYQWKTFSFAKPHIVVYDFGVKANILRLLESMGSDVTVVPATFPIQQLLALQPDGILLSNGPGDPLAYNQIIDLVKTLVTMSIPILGICLGHQLLGIALGARIEKLKFGHHGINHPIKELQTGRVFISSQNHNFALSDNELPSSIEVTHRSLFDSSIQGIRHKQKSIYGIQGHPEACPGPTELSILFEPFLLMASQYHRKKQLELQNA